METMESCWSAPPGAYAHAERGSIRCSPLRSPLRLYIRLFNDVTREGKKPITTESKI